MKSIKGVLPVLIVLFSVNLLYSQPDYKPGFIISNHHDTIQGFINLRSNINNSNKCEFKKNLDSEAKIYLPGDIIGYNIENTRYYVTKQIKIDESEQTVFLEFLVDGIVDLYYLKKPLADYYFIEKDGVMYELSNEEMTFFDKNYKEYTKSSNQYIGMLTWLFKEAPGLQDEIKDIDFSYKPLIRMTKKYHYLVCDSYDCIDYTKSTESNFYVESNFGIINSWMGLKKSDDYAFNSKPYFGINLRFTPIKSYYLLNFILGLNYSSNNFSGRFENTLFSESVKTHQITASYSVLRIPIILEYSFPLDNYQPFVSVGYNNIFILNPSYEVKRVYDDPNIPEGIENTDFRKYQNGFSFGIGVKYWVNNNSYFILRNEFEYRLPGARFGRFLDYHSVRSVIVNLGYGFKI